MSTQIEVCILFAALASISGCSSATKLYRSVFHGSDNPLHNTPEITEFCTNNKATTRHSGIALQVGSGGVTLLSANGNLPNLQVGTSSLVLYQNEIEGAKASEPIANFDLSHGTLSAAKGEIANRKIFLFAGSPTPKKVLDKREWLTFKGKGQISLKPPEGKTTQYSGVATLNINPTNNMVDLRFDLDNKTAPFVHLNWTQISYCDGFFQSTGIGRYRLTAPSGRLTNLVGNSNDGSAGTAILSGLIYGDDDAKTAAIAFALSGASNTIYSVISLPRSQS